MYELFARKSCVVIFLKLLFKSKLLLKLLNFILPNYTRSYAMSLIIASWQSFSLHRMWFRNQLYVGYSSDRNSSYVHGQLMYWKRSSLIKILVSLKCGTLFVNVWAYSLIPFRTFYCHELMIVNIKQCCRVFKFWKNNISYKDVRD